MTVHRNMQTRGTTKASRRAVYDVHRPLTGYKDATNFRFYERNPGKQGLFNCMGIVMQNRVNITKWFILITTGKQDMPQPIREQNSRSRAHETTYSQTQEDLLLEGKFMLIKQ